MIQYPDVSTLEWTPFQRAYVDDSQFNSPEARARYQMLADNDPDPLHDAAFYERTYRSLVDDECYRNSRYLVFVRRTMADNGEGGVVEMVHLSVKRHDQKTIHDWRDMQRIKNELLGPECEAVELFPAESRVVDTANQYHLWGVNDPTFRWPLGWHEGQHKVEGLGIGEEQRPFEVDTTHVEVRPYKTMWEALKDVLAKNGTSLKGDDILAVMKRLETHGK